MVVVVGKTRHICAAMLLFPPLNVNAAWALRTYFREQLFIKNSILSSIRYYSPHIYITEYYIVSMYNVTVVTVPVACCTWCTLITSQPRADKYIAFWRVCTLELEFRVWLCIWPTDSDSSRLELTAVSSAELLTYKFYKSWKRLAFVAFHTELST